MLLMEKSFELSFLFLTLFYVLDGVRVKKKKIKACAMEVMFVIHLKRTLLFGGLLIRLKRKRRKSRGVEDMLLYPVRVVSPVQPFSLRNFK